MKPKRPFLQIFLSSALALFLTSCLEPGFQLEQTIKEAIAQAEEGNAAAAVNKLESLQSKHPQNPDVAEALGIAYQEKDNHLLAANYFKKAARLSPEKRHLLRNSAENLFEASRVEDGISRLQEYLDAFPEDGETWLRLGHLQYDVGRNDVAMDAMTRGILLTDPAEQNAVDHQILGSLYLEAQDFPQADFYFNQALTLGAEKQVEALALMGLIESSILQKDWDVAEIFIGQLKSVHPEFYQTPDAQKFESRIAKARRSQVPDHAPGEDLPEPEEPLSEEEESTGDNVENERLTDETPADSAELPDITGDPVDEAAMETLPTPEMGESEKPAESADEVLPDQLPPSVSELGTPLPEETELTPEGEENDQPEESAGDVGEDQTEVEQELLDDDDSGETEEGYTPPENESELLVLQAKQHIVEQNYPAAIRVAWDSINRNPASPAAWFMLSYAYSKFGQYLNAESAALEAVRLNPNNKKIVFQYLSVIQFSQSADRFHEELINAYRRFSDDPDFILALARSFARIKNDPENAAVLYRRFLELAPEHPKAERVRQEIEIVQ